MKNLKVKIVGSGFAFLLAVLAGWEGKKLVAYYDTGGVPTICYGRTEGVKIGDTASEEQCLLWLKQEAGRHFEWVDRYIDVPMEPWQHVAFASLSYNIGTRAFAGSTLVKKANAGDMDGACREILRWVYDNGKKVQGLVNRRHYEYQLCMGIGVTK